MEDAANADVSSALPPPARRPSLPDIEPSRRDQDERRLSPFLPMLLLVLGALAWPAFQCYQLVNEKQTIATIYATRSAVRRFREASERARRARPRHGVACHEWQRERQTHRR